MKNRSDLNAQERRQLADEELDLATGGKHRPGAHDGFGYPKTAWDGCENWENSYRQVPYEDGKCGTCIYWHCTEIGAFNNGGPGTCDI